ncbi:MAG: purine-nucleoside phosphorylase [Myxococcota bacterium]
MMQVTQMVSQAAPVDLAKRVVASAQAVREHLDCGDDAALASVGVVLGSGLGHFAKQLEADPATRRVDYKEIPYFAASQVQGHRGQLLLCRLQQRPVLMLQGRVHCYEGHAAWQTALPIRTLHALGVRRVVLTGAAGAIGEHLHTGDLMLMTDHINLTGQNPLMGHDDAQLGARFVDMTDCYCPHLRQLAQRCAAQQQVVLKEGVYAGVLGPTYETPAEVRMLKTLGADAVAMSVVAEAIAARHAGASVLGIACMTNKAAGLSAQQLDHDDVQRVAARSSQQFTALMQSLLPQLAID